jgi:hypothetical protein
MFLHFSQTQILLVIENKIRSLKNSRETQRVKLDEINITIFILQHTYLIPNVSDFLDHPISELYFSVLSFYFHSSMLNSVLSYENAEILYFTECIVGDRVFIS